jgi:hypothetical protein
MIDDLFMILLENIADNANRQYHNDLINYMKRITLMYARGLLDRETFEVNKAEVLRTIEAHSLQLERRRGRARSLEWGL